MNLQIGNKLRWIKGDNFNEVETIKTPEDLEYVYFESGRRINPEVISEFMIEDFGEDFGGNNTINNDLIITEMPKIVEKIESEFLLLFKGRNIIDKKIKFDLNLKIPTEFIIKGLLSAYGLSEIEPSLILMIKKQILDNIEEISKNIAYKITEKIKK